MNERIYIYIYIEGVTSPVVFISVKLGLAHKFYGLRDFANTALREIFWGLREGMVHKVAQWRILLFVVRNK